jgi:transposase-like protein
LIWLWVATIGFEIKEILGITISKERNMLLAERFISSLVGIHGSQHPVSTDGGTWYPSTGLQVFEIASSSYPFFLWEEHYIKNNAVHDKR